MRAGQAATAAGMAMAELRDVTVSIFGSAYTLRSEADPDYLQSLADQIDTRMREAARGCGPIAADRLAVLVALNLADDLARAGLHAGPQGAREAPQRRLERLIAMLAEEVGSEGVQGV